MGRQTAQMLGLQKGKYVGVLGANYSLFHLCVGRCMWAEFEWENKVAVNTSITDPVKYLRHIVACTNMAVSCFSPHSLDVHARFCDVLKDTESSARADVAKGVCVFV
jgi:hypothetical protein